MLLAAYWLSFLADLAVPKIVMQLLTVSAVACSGNQPGKVT